MLLSSVGIAMMMLYIFITFENPLERFDRKTGEFTRNSLVEMLKECFARGKSFEVVEIVLMDYAGLMSGYGYDAGVAYHKAVAQRLHEITGCSVFNRHSDTMVIIWETDKTMLHGSFEEIKKKIDSPVVYDGRQLGVRSRMNVVSCPEIGNNMDTVSKILDYMLHEAEKSNCEISVARADTLEAQRRSAGVEELVAKAVTNDGLNVLMQPIYNTKTGRIMAAEALVRLKDCGGFGFISPEEFIPIAERKALIWPCFDGDNRERSRDVLTNAINMIHATGSRIVAEGIENAEQKDAIIKWGVEYIQGYYFSKPIEGDRFIEFVKDFNSKVVIDT